MQTFPKPILKSALSLAAVSLAALGVSAAISGVHAQDQPEITHATTTASYAEFQYAAITGSNNVLNVTMLPVVTSTGTIYKNLTLQVNVDASGNVTVASGSPMVVNAPTILASTFKAGTYVGPSTINGGENMITVTGPAVVPGGTTDWSLTTPSNAAECTYPASATWYVGSPTAVNNPLAGRLQKAGITSTAYSYGTAGDSEACPPNPDAWTGGTLIGVSQTGNSITITSFSTLGTFDSSTPKDQITYTHQ